MIPETHTYRDGIAATGKGRKPAAKHKLSLPEDIEIKPVGRGPALPTIQRSTQPERPKAEWVRGHCPECGEELISNMYYTGGHGYLIVWECWASLGEEPACSYRRVI